MIDWIQRGAILAIGVGSLGDKALVYDYILDLYELKRCQRYRHCYVSFWSSYIHVNLSASIKSGCKRDESIEGILVCDPIVKDI